MKKLKTYSEFLSEGIVDVLNSPIKYAKIKNNAKKLVKAKVAVALNDVNFENVVGQDSLTRFDKKNNRYKNKKKKVWKKA